MVKLEESLRTNESSTGSTEPSLGSYPIGDQFSPPEQISLYQQLAYCTGVLQNWGIKKTPDITQDSTARRAEYKTGLSGIASPNLPPGVDALAYASGVIEGQAAHGQKVARLPVRNKL